MLAASDAPIIGIDLGTSTSEIAFLRNGEPELIQDERGDRVIPSVAQLSPEGQIIVGSPAKSGAITFADRTVQEVKRLMGTDATVTMGDKTFRPEEVSAMILRHLVRAAEARFGKESIVDVVISVPARFENPAREATKRAAELAGLNVLRLINEPTAAALSYGLNHLNDEQRVLVFDFGGGTLDVTILEMLEGVLDVKTSVGDDRLGGKDIDELFIARLRNEYTRKFSDDGLNTERAKSLLKQEAERYKKELSFSQTVYIDLPYLSAQGGITDLRITRQEFEDMLAPLAKRSMALVDEALTRAKLSWSDIDVVLPVGGSSRIPLFRRVLEEHWGKPLRDYDNPDEAVARGAAIAAGIAQDSFGDDGMLVLDNTPHRLGTDVLERIGNGQFVPHYFSEVIAKDAKLPAMGSRLYSTVYDDQTEVKISIYEAATDSNLCKDHRLVGEMLLENIPASPSGEQLIQLDFHYTSDGTLHATAFCLRAPEIKIDEKFVVTGRGDATQNKAAKATLDTLWQNSEDVKRCRPLLDQAENLEREKPEVASQVRPVADALRSALINGDKDQIEKQVEALSDVLFDLS